MVVEKQTKLLCCSTPATDDSGDADNEHHLLKNYYSLEIDYYDMTLQAEGGNVMVWCGGGWSEWRCV